MTVHLSPVPFLSFSPSFPLDPIPLSSHLHSHGTARSGTAAAFRTAGYRTAGYRCAAADDPLSLPCSPLSLVAHEDPF